MTAISVGNRRRSVVPTFASCSVGRGSFDGSGIFATVSGSGVLPAVFYLASTRIFVGRGIGLFSCRNQRVSRLPRKTPQVLICLSGPSGVGL